MEDMMMISPLMVELSGFVGDNAQAEQLYRWTNMKTAQEIMDLFGQNNYVVMFGQDLSVWLGI